MTTRRKKLIETSLPLDAINKASVREKSIRHGHPSTLHLWWARRPLATCRAVLFAQFVDDPSSWPDLFPTLEEQERERHRLFRIIEDLVKWENSNDEAVLHAARQEIARSLALARERDGVADSRDDSIIQGAATSKAVREYLLAIAPPVYDPFTGGGSIPLEAQRLGLRAIGTDLNPVPVLLNRALIELPAKLNGRVPIGPPVVDEQEKLSLKAWPKATALAEDVRRYGAWMKQEADGRIGNLYPNVKIPEALGGGEATVIAWLWARTVASPDPSLGGKHVPLVKSFYLSSRRSKRAWVVPKIDKSKGTYEFTVETGIGEPPEGTVNRRGGRCLVSGTPIPFAYIREEGKAGRLGQRLLAIVAEGDRSRLFLPPSPEQERIAESAVPNDLPEVPIEHWPGCTNCVLYGLTRFDQLFSKRQSTALQCFSDLIPEVFEKVTKDGVAAGHDSDLSREYARAVSLYLALGVDRLADRMSAMCGWDHGYTKIRNTFGRQAIPMNWDYAEGNPFSSSTGNFSSAIDLVAKVIEASPVGVPGTVRQQDAATLDQGDSKFVYSTDPPYYDNIPYANLSDFFYLWLRRSLHEIYPEALKTVAVPRAEELVANRARHGSRENAERFFLEGMKKFFERMYETVDPTIPATVYYAFKQAEVASEGISSTGWAVFLQAIIESGFSVTGTWPMRTELANRMMGIGNNALASSVVLVCRKRLEAAESVTRAEFLRHLRQELPEALKILELGAIAPVDMAQSSIGPGMAIFSRYGSVIEANGSQMSVRSALQLINEVVDEIRGEEEGVLDNDTRFALTWYEIHGYEEGSFGEADTLAKARNVSVAGVQEAGILLSAAGKVRVLPRGELPDSWNPAEDDRPTVWEATQHLIKTLEENGEGAAASLLGKLGEKGDSARTLAYRLYASCERRGWADEAQAYNGLVIAWPELEKLSDEAGSIGDSAPQAELFE